MSPINVDIKVSVKGSKQHNLLMSPINVDIKVSVKGSKQY